MKVCISCNKNLSISMFHKDKDRERKSTCKACRSKQDKIYRKKNLKKLTKSIRIIEKKCSKCLLILPIYRFDNDTIRKDGYSCSCKLCRSKVSKKYYKKRRLELINYQNEYRKYNKDKIRKRNKIWTQKTKAIRREKLRAYRLKNKERLKQNNQNWINRDPLRYKKLCAKTRKRNKHKINVRTKLHSAIAVSKVKKLSCIFCGNNNSEAHHCDYNKPLDVLWLCKKHHMAWHRVFLAEQLK